MPRFYSKLKQISASLAACILLPGCFVTEVLPFGSKTSNKSRPIPTPETPAVEPRKSEFPTLAAPRLMRRLTLDLAASLPNQTDIETLLADAELFPTFLNSYLANNETPRQIAQLHKRIWPLNFLSFPDLDALVAAGDTSLGAALTPAVRRHINEEPSLMVRYMLEHNRPYSDIFSAGFTIVHRDALSIFDLTSSGEPWPSEPYAFVSYDDGRPAAGIIDGFALPANFSSRGGVLRHRMARMLQMLSCHRTEQSEAHLFYDLTAEELAGDLSLLAATKAPCLACHSHFEGAAAAARGIGTGDELTSWTTYTAPDDTPQAYYSGIPYVGLDELGALVGNDPRTHKCMVERLAAAIYQRPATVRDSRVISLALNDFYAHGLKLTGATKHIFLSSEYAYARIAQNTPAEAERLSSGVKFLRRQHWQGIAEQLLGSSARLEFPEALDPGADEAFTSSYAIPSGSYWYEAEALARSLAEAIVSTELSPGRLAATRRVFKDLPDGTGETADAALIQEQIKSTWKLLTSEDLSEAGTQLPDLVALWVRLWDGNSGNDAEAFKRAWIVMLTGMLTHPNFLTY